MASTYSCSEVAIICLDLLWTQQNLEGFSHFLDFPCPMIRPYNLSSPRFYVTDKKSLKNHKGSRIISARSFKATESSTEMVLR